MRTLVTGGAGFIGSALATALLERGDEVVVLDNLLGGFRDNVPEGAEFVEGDLRDPETVAQACSGVEIVYHQAAIRSVPRSLDEPSLVNESNITGTLNLLIAAEAEGVRRVVYASSSSVYGGAFEGASSEDMTPNPMSPYAVSKLGGEYYCRTWAALGKVSTVSLRYFNVFGPGQRADSKYAAVFPAFVSALSRGESPEVHWDGKQSRDFTYIDDVVQANLAAAESPSADGLAINIAGGQPRTILGVYEDISAVLGVSIEPKRVAKRPGDIRHSHADLKLARENLGWNASTPWSDAVKATVSWFGS